MIKTKEYFSLSAIERIRSLIKVENGVCRKDCAFNENRICAFSVWSSPVGFNKQNKTCKNLFFTVVKENNRKAIGVIKLSLTGFIMSPINCNSCSYTPDINENKCRLFKTILSKNNTGEYIRCDYCKNFLKSDYI